MRTLRRRFLEAQTLEALPKPGALAAWTNIECLDSDCNMGQGPITEDRGVNSSQHYFEENLDVYDTVAVLRT